MATEPTEIITASVISHNRRTAFLPRLFGAYHLIAQNHIFKTAENHSKDYTGGSWEFKELSIGGGYLVPKCAEEFYVSVSGNHFSGTLSADAAGIVFTLFTINALIWHAYHNEFFHIQDMLTRQEERLKQFAREHVEGARIFAAID